MRIDINNRLNSFLTRYRSFYLRSEPVRIFPYPEWRSLPPKTQVRNDIELQAVGIGIQDLFHRLSCAHWQGAFFNHNLGEVEFSGFAGRSFPML